MSNDPYFAVACPICEAKAGDPCHSADGTVLPSMFTHPERVAKSAAKQRPARPRKQRGQRGGPVPRTRAGQNIGLARVEHQHGPAGGWIVQLALSDYRDDGGQISWSPTTGPFADREGALAYAREQGAEWIDREQPHVDYAGVRLYPGDRVVGPDGRSVGTIQYFTGPDGDTNDEGRLIGMASRIAVKYDGDNDLSFEGTHSTAQGPGDADVWMADDLEYLGRKTT